MNLTLRDIEYFVAVVEHGGLARAAVALGISQPALSKSLKRLEEESGLLLLHRDSRPIQPTSAGLVFLEHARRLRAEYHDAVRNAAELRAGAAGLLRLGATGATLDDVVLPVLARLLPRRPAMRVQITAALSDELAAQVESGQLDIAVLPTYDGAGNSPDTLFHDNPLRLAPRLPVGATRQDTVRTADTGFKFIRQDALRGNANTVAEDESKADAVAKRERCVRLPLIEEALPIVAARHHPLAQRPKVLLHELQRQRWVLPKASSHARKLIDDAFAAAGLPAPIPALEVDSVTHGVLDLVLSLEAIAAVPEITLRRAGQLPLVRLPVPLERRLYRHISVIGRNRTIWSPLMTEFYELLVQDLGAPGNPRPPARGQT
ncbi:MAG: LysR substrate-binding domain-containing protein [Pigmentiphaga sp.]|nr:LysR substrate-binding domain-containing protein [Pigmentiphaga sp.]